MTSKLKRSKRFEEEEETGDKPASLLSPASAARQRPKPPRPRRPPPVSRSLTTTTSLTNKPPLRGLKGELKPPKRGVINHAATFDETATTPPKRPVNRIVAMKTIPGAMPDDLQNGVPTLPELPLRLSPYNERTYLKIDHLSIDPKPTKRLYFISLLASVGGFMVGYDFTIISTALTLIKHDLTLSAVKEQLTVSLALASACLCALLAGLLTERLGRRPVIITAALLYSIAAVSSALSFNQHLLLAARTLAGAALGLTSMATPLYIAEVSAPVIRGRLVCSFFLMVAAGQLVANLLYSCFALVPNGWRYMVGAGMLPGAVQLAGLFLMPESPHWLVQHARLDVAKQVLERLRGQQEVREEVTYIRQAWEDAEFDRIQTASLIGTDLSDIPKFGMNKGTSINGIVNQGCMPAICDPGLYSGEPSVPWQMMTTPWARRALFMGCSLHIIQQFTGFNAVMHSNKIVIKMVGLSSDVMATWLSCATSALFFLCVIVGVYLVEKLGRRPLLIGSLLGVLVSLSWLAVGFHLAAIYSPRVSVYESLPNHVHCGSFITCDACVQDGRCGFCFLSSNSQPQNGSCLPVMADDHLMSAGGRCNVSQVSLLASGHQWAYDYCPTSYFWMPLVGLLLYQVFFAPGMGPMVWTLNTEVFPLWCRCTGIALATCVSWLCNLLVTLTYPSLVHTITRYGTLWLYACLSLVGLVFFWFYLPETKGKLLEEAEGVFAHAWCGQDPPQVSEQEESSVQYVHIRGLNRDGQDSEDIESPE